MGFPSQLAALANEFIGDKRVLSGNGYQKLPGGLILQWGSGFSGGQTVVSVNFLLVFPNAVLHVVIGNWNNTSGLSSYSAWLHETASNLTVAGFRWAHSGGGAPGIRYIAIGY